MKGESDGGGGRAYNQKGFSVIRLIYYPGEGDLEAGFYCRCPVCLKPGLHMRSNFMHAN